jgi:Colicin V production protein
MTWVDAIPIVLVLVYALLGYLTGVMRRLIGLVSLYLACVAATNMGLQAGGILQQSSNYPTADARIYGFFGILFAVIIVIDGAAQLANSQIQIQAIVFNRVSGVIIGALTGLLLSVLVTYELQAAGNPFGGTQLDDLQQTVRDGVNGSHVAVPIVRAIGRPIISLFQPVLPADPQIYFGPGPVNP